RLGPAYSAKLIKQYPSSFNRLSSIGEHCLWSQVMILRWAFGVSAVGLISVSLAYYLASRTDAQIQNVIEPEPLVPLSSSPGGSSETPLPEGARVLSVADGVELQAPFVLRPDETAVGGTALS